MATDPGKGCSEQWVVDLLDRELRAVRESIAVRTAAQEQAASLMERTLTARFEAQNEWRAQLDRERANFVRVEQHNALDSDVRRLQKNADQLAGGLNLIRFGGLAGLLALMGVIAEILIAVFKR
jgi:hypothetical protein